METDFTKREYIALKAMQGVMANSKASPKNKNDLDIIVKDCFMLADAFIQYSKDQE